MARATCREAIEAQIEAEYEPRRWDGYFHVSQLGGCSRVIYDHANGYEEAMENKSLLIFQTGHLYHAMIQGYLARAGVVISEEQELVSEEHKIKGSCDNIVQVLAYPEILEIKTINTDKFKDLQGALVAHVLQAMTYAWLSGLTKSVIILYIDKNTSQIKEFRYPYNQTLIDEMLEKLAHIKKSLETKNLPTEFLDLDCAMGYWKRWCYRVSECKALDKKTKKEGRNATIVIPGL